MSRFQKFAVLWNRASRGFVKLRFARFWLKAERKKFIFPSEFAINSNIKM